MNQTLGWLCDVFAAAAEQAVLRRLTAGRLKAVAMVVLVFPAVTGAAAALPEALAPALTVPPSAAPATSDPPLPDALRAPPTAASEPAPATGPENRKTWQVTSVDPWNSLSDIIDMVKAGLPAFPLVGQLDAQTMLPTIKKVYPTGEKPLVIFNFKCPTELFGITPPPIKALHELVNLGLDGINKTDLLPFNMQQVCS